MHPLLFKIPIFGGVEIRTYGFLVSLGFVSGILWVVRESKRLSLDTDSVLDLIFWIIFSGIIGSRLNYLIITDPSRIIREPWSVIALWEGGLVYYGGLISAILVVLIYTKRKRLSLPVYADVIAPAVALGHAFGRIGCFMAGCCYGAVAHGSAIAVVFPDDPRGIAPPGIPLYPTQLMESLGEFLIFFILVLIRRRKRFDGEVFSFYLVFYAILRFCVEFFRGDERGFIMRGILSHAQGISILLFVVGLTLLARGFIKARVAR